MPKISVIVPVYNTEQYLHRCIDSILAQTFTDFELLLIDDGSKDSSGKICDEYAAKDPRVRVFHKENGGVSSARNMGLDNVRGEWVTFCDSDDYVELWWLSLFVKELDGYDCIAQKFSNVLLSVCLESSFDGEANKVLTFLYEKRLLGYCYLKLFRTEILKKYRIYFDECVRFREDEDFVLRYFCKINKVKYIGCARGGYVYIMPDLEKKYSGYDNYYVLASMFKSVNEIYEGKAHEVVNSYLNEYVLALFSSFSSNISDKNKRISMFKKLVGRRILDVDAINKITRYILFLFPTVLIVPIFILKRKLRFLISV